MGAFLAVLAIPRINNLRVINTPNSSTPAASTNTLFIINHLQKNFNFVQWHSAIESFLHSFFLGFSSR